MCRKGKKEGKTKKRTKETSQRNRDEEGMRKQQQHNEGRREVSLKMIRTMRLRGRQVKTAPKERKEKPKTAHKNDRTREMDNHNITRRRREKENRRGEE